MSISLSAITQAPHLDPARRHAAGLQAGVDGDGLGRPASAATAVLSIDVEDYFHVAAFRGTVRREDWGFYPSRVEANVDRLLDLCDTFGVKATWFVLGWEARHRPEMVRRIADRGHEVGCHSYWHREVFSLSPAEFIADTRLAKEVLENACGRRILGYRAPSFSITKDSLWALEALRELGFAYDSSVFPVYHRRYGIPGAPHYPFPIQTDAGTLWELPPATAPLFGRRVPVAGGAYLRHFPYPLLVAGLDRLTAGEGLPAMLYLHPWEIDPGQPELHVSRMTRLRHRRNLHRTEARLARLMRRFSFVTAEALVAAYAHRAEKDAQTATPVEGSANAAAEARAGSAPDVPSQRV